MSGKRACFNRDCDQEFAETCVNQRAVKAKKCQIGRAKNKESNFVLNVHRINEHILCVIK